MDTINPAAGTHESSAFKTAQLIDACPESLESPTPTPLEFAFEAMSIGKVHRQDVMTYRDKSGDEPFSRGWEAGIEYQLDIASLPVDVDDPKATQSWLVGFIAGQYAGAHGYGTPFCLFPGHEH